MKLFGGKRRSARSGKSAASNYSESNPASAPVPAKRGRLTGLQRGLLLLVASLLVLGGVVFGVYHTLVRPMDVTGSAVQTDGEKQMHKILTVDDKTGEEIEVDYEVPGCHKEGYYNILVVGTDGDGTRTDTIMIARLDTNDHTVALMSIPRDTLINANYSVPKINSVYGVNGKGKEGLSALKKYVTAMVGFEVDGYVLVNLEAFQKTVDLIGGVPFDVPQNMYYNDPSQDLYINLSAGEQVLDGEHAMQLVRFRKYAEADIQRTRVQQDFLKAFAKQCLKVGNLTKIQSFAEIFHDNVLTDLTVGNMIYFGKELMNCDFDQMQTYTLPGQGVSINGGSYYALFASQVLKIVNESFNPYDADISLSNLNIRGGASGGSSGSSSSSGSSGSSGHSSTKPSGSGSPQTQTSSPETSSETSAETQPEETTATETEANGVEVITPGNTSTETGAETTAPATESQPETETTPGTETPAVTETVPETGATPTGALKS